MYSGLCSTLHAARGVVELCLTLIPVLLWCDCSQTNKDDGIMASWDRQQDVLGVSFGQVVGYDRCCLQVLLHFFFPICFS